MALISCNECSKQISDKATACPQCGYPLKQPTKGTSVYDYPSSSSKAAYENTSNASSDSGGCSTVLGGVAMIGLGLFVCVIAFKVFNFIIGAVGGVMALIGFALMSISS